jgi:hypothetical protein
MNNVFVWHVDNNGDLFFGWPYVFYFVSLTSKQSFYLDITGKLFIFGKDRVEL